MTKMYLAKWKHCAGALALAALLVVPRPAPAAQLGAAVPEGSLMAIEITDSAAFWQKTSALPLTQAIAAYLGSPAMTSNLGYQQFDLERQKWAQALGYPATPEELMANVFSRVLFYVPPNKGGGAAGAGVIVLGVKDKAKAAKLVALVDQRNAEAAKAGAAAGTTTGTMTFDFTFEKLKIGSADVSHFKSNSGNKSEGFYALAGDKLVFSNDRTRFIEAIGAAKPEGAALETNDLFNKLKAPLAWDQAEVVGWVDADAIAKTAAAGVGNPMLSAAAAMPSNEKVAFTAQVLSKGLLSKSVTLVDPAAQSPGFKPATLASLGQYAARPLLVLATGMFDPVQTLQMTHSMGALNQIMQMIPGAAAGAAAPDFTQLFAKFEASTGVSVERDIVPALGNEVSLGLNSMTTDPGSILPIPLIDLVISLRTRDKAKMQAIMAKLEPAMLKQLEAFPNSNTDANGQAVPRAFKSVPAGMTQIRVLDLGMGDILKPSYAVAGDYLLIGLNDRSVTSAVARMSGGSPSHTSSPIYGEMAQYAGGAAKMNSYSELDAAGLTRFLATLLPAAAGLLPNLNQQEATSIMINVLTHLGVGASITTAENGLAISYSRLDME